MFHNFNQSLRRNLNPTFKLYEKGSYPGIHQLNPLLTINGITQEPEFRYKAQDASPSGWPAWTYGPALTYYSSNHGAQYTPDYNLDTPLYGPLDGAIRFGKAYGVANFPAGYFKASTTTPGNVTTEDYVIEAVLELCGYCDSPSIPVFCMGVYDGTNGWELYGGPAGGLQNFGVITRQSSPNVIAEVYASSIFDFAWCHVLYFHDKSGSGILYLNGTPSTAYNVSTLTNIQSSTVPLIIGATSSGSNAYPGRINYLCMWKRNDWLDTHLQAAVAKERANRLFNIWPQYTIGSYATSSQSITGYLFVDKYDEANNKRKLFFVHQGWSRSTRRKDINNRVVTGLLFEQSRQNIVFSTLNPSSGFSKTNAGDTLSTGGTIPLEFRVYNQVAEASTLTADATTTKHGYVQNVSSTTNTTNTISAWLKKGNKQYAILENSTIANCYAFFDLQNGTVGTVGSALYTTYIENWGDGWYRCGIVFNSQANGNITISTTDADNTFNCTGDGTTISLYMWGPEYSYSHYLTSHVPRMGAYSYGYPDALEWANPTSNGILPVSSGMITFDTLIDLLNFIPNNIPTGDYRYRYMFSVESSNTNILAHSIRAENYIHNFIYANSTSYVTYNILPNVDSTDGTSHMHRLAYTLNRKVTYHRDQVLLGSSANTFTVLFANFTRLIIGNSGYYGDSRFFGGGSCGVISNFKAYKRPWK